MEFQRASGEQFSMLLEFMENHGDLARTRAGPLARLKADRLWVTLTESLNSIGHGVRKTTERWKRVWADWKCKTKKKLITMRRNGNKVKFSNFEERLLALMDSSKVDKLADVEYLEVDNINSSADLEFTPLTPKIEISVESVSSPVPPENSSIRSPVQMQQTSADPFAQTTRPSNTTLRRRQLRGLRRRMFMQFDRTANMEQRYLLVDERHERNESRRLELEKIRERTESRRVELEEMRERAEDRRLDLEEMREKTEARRVEIEEKRQMTEIRRLEVEEMQMKAQTQLLHRLADIAEACVELYRRQINGS